MICKLCGEVVIVKYKLKGSRESLNIEASYCSGCDIHFCESQDYDYSNSDENIINYYEHTRAYIESRQKNIFNFVREFFCPEPGVFLDVGSGMGYSLVVAKSLGWYPVGIEPNTVLEEYSRKKLQLNTLNAYLIQDKLSSIRKLLPEGYADYILIDNVLEHIPEPVEFFKNTMSLIKPGGLLLIAIPPVDWFRLGLVSISCIRQNSTSAQLNLFYDPEQHINYFSRKAIKILTEKVGGCKLSDSRFHHSKLLNSWLARFLKFETGYYFIVKDV